MWPFVVLAKLEFAKIFGNYGEFGEFGEFGEWPLLNNNSSFTTIQILNPNFNIYLAF